MFEFREKFINTHLFLKIMSFHDHSCDNRSHVLMKNSSHEEILLYLSQYSISLINVNRYIVSFSQTAKLSHPDEESVSSFPYPSRGVYAK